MSDETEPKIIIDEDWKSRVETEKKAAAEKTAADAKLSEPAAATAKEVEPAAQSASQRPVQIPPATFSFS
jgi:hypothetical protein